MSFSPARFASARRFSACLAISSESDSLPVSFCICSSTTFFTASSAASLIPRVIFGEENVPPMFTPTDWSVFPPGTATRAL